MLRDAFLAIHITAGTTGLLLLPAIILRPKGTVAHVRMGRAFLWCLRVVTASAAVLAVIKFSQLWWFLLIAAFSLALGEVGSRGWRHGFIRAVNQHISGMGGAAIAFVTAVLVVNAGTLNAIAWIAPSVVGSVVISVTITRILRRGTIARNSGRIDAPATL
jgi:hypothetical protein